MSLDGDINLITNVFCVVSYHWGETDGEVTRIVEAKIASEKDWRFQFGKEWATDWPQKQNSPTY